MLLSLRSKYTIFCGIFVAILIILSSCDMRPTAMGDQNRIIVVADSSLWNEVEDDVRSAFETILYTPVKEMNFYIKRIELSELNEYKSRMNIFLLGTTADNNEMNEYLGKQMPAIFIEGVDNGKSFYVLKNDFLVRNQIGLVMMAPTIEDFKERLSLLREEIYQEFEDAHFTRLKETTFRHGSNEDIEEILVNNYGWKVKIQRDFFLAIHDLEDKFVWLRRLNPDRWLSIWEVKGDSSIFHQDSLFNIRDRITKKYYSGDIVVRRESYVIKSKFQNRTTTKIVGIWSNDGTTSGIIVGGPFRTYIIPDKDGTKFYFIDIAVQAPNKEKKPFLDQLEVMASTFEVIDPNTESDK